MEANKHNILVFHTAQFQNFFSEVVINQLTAAGGVLILGIGLNLLEIRKIRVTNLLPSLVVVVILTLIFS